MAASTLYLVGQRLNHLENAAGVTPTSVAADYPISNLFDGRSLAPFKFNVGAASLSILTDLQLLTNGGLELGAGATFTGWTPATSGTGAIAQETVIVGAGSRAVKLNGGTGVAVIRQDITVRAGATVIVQLLMRGPGLARVEVYNPRTYKVYVPGTGWVAGSAGPTLSESGTTGLYGNTQGYYLKTVAIPVESYEICQANTVSLQIYCGSRTAADTYFDAITAFPLTNFVSIHGHNISPGTAVTIESVYDTDHLPNGGSVADGSVSMTVSQPSFYKYISEGIERRYIRLKFTDGGGATISPITALGELILGQGQTFSHGPVHPRRAPWRTTVARAQVRHETAAGDAHVYLRSSYQRRRLELPYDGTDSFMRGFRLELQQRSENGLYPMVIVPDTNLPEVIHGRVEAGHNGSRVFANKTGTSSLDQGALVVQESAFPQLAL